MDVLYPTKQVVKEDFSGKLLIDGDLDDNCILFRFLFDKPEMVHPLIITVRTLPITSSESYLKRNGDQEERNFVFECNIPDLSNSIMKTRLLFPDFLIREHKIEVIRIESQVSCCVC
jgi:hypothetical protein